MACRDVHTCFSFDMLMAAVLHRFCHILIRAGRRLYGHAHMRTACRTAGWAAGSQATSSCRMPINSSNRNASKQSESQPHCMDDCKAPYQIASASATLKPVVQPTCPLMHLNLVTLQHPYVTSCTFSGAVQGSPAGDGALPLQPPKRRWRLWPAR